MLVLRRKPGEAIVLNQDVTIIVLGIEGERVKLGIIAPPDVVVVREELLTGTQNVNEKKVPQRVLEAQERASVSEKGELYARGTTER